MKLLATYLITVPIPLRKYDKKQQEAKHASPTTARTRAAVHVQL